MLALFRYARWRFDQRVRSFEQRGRIELISSAATHGFLPLLARDESIKLQLAVGVAEHKRLFGRAPTGCWLPSARIVPAERGDRRRPDASRARASPRSRRASRRGRLSLFLRGQSPGARRSGTGLSRRKRVARPRRADTVRRLSGRILRPPRPRSLRVRARSQSVVAGVVARRGISGR